MPNAKTSRALCAFLAALSLLVPGVALTSALRSKSSHDAAGASVAGSDAGFSFTGNILQWDTSKLQHEFADAKAIGATWLRVPFNWATLEMHGKGKFNWAPADKVVYIARSYGLNVEAVVSYAPAWARPRGTDDLTPPSNFGDYGDFIYAAVKHYAPMGVRTWEIWNEPNMSDMWHPKPNIGRYTQLLKIAYLRVKQADKNTTVLTGGTSPAPDDPAGYQIKPTTFLNGVYANGGHGYFDAVSHHPSTFPSPSSTVGSWSSFQQTKDMYASMVAHGDGNKRIWGTEIAFPTGTSSRSVNESTQGSRFVQSYQLWRKWSFTGPLFIFSLRDSGTNKSDPWENYGVDHYDGSHKSGWGAIQSVIKAKPVAYSSPAKVKVYPGTGRVVEGDRGTRLMWIPVFLSAASTKTVTAHYATLSFGQRYQAAVPQDYHAASGTVTFAPGKRWTLVPVVVVGDTLKEPNDAFLIGLSKPTNAVIGGFGGLGRGVIVNDD